MNRALRERRREIEAARAGTGRAGVDTAVRREVLASWDRCAGGLPVSLAAAPLDGNGGGGTMADRWEVSPIRQVAPSFADELQQVATDGDMVAAVTDDRGRILWSGGSNRMARRAEQVHFTPGGCWDERSAGTNAPALALLTGEPATVFSVEHWCEAVHDWVCYAAPVRDGSGRTVGVIDLSTTWDQAHPLGLATVTAMARLVETRLSTVRPTESATALSAPALELRALGHPRVVLDDTPLLLPLRQLEIVCLLVLRGEATLDDLHAL
ncbi:MAG TPA: GAF domain-containing protein, partial [Acidimicrobiia bacterium]|nr:GAF domain-containing protein [Acidimicrobiia bacterium]